ncbi:MAG: ATP-binding protein, partial [Candidatus Diapherotrites archaeon]|nr:ATP-binding protein [Candidatus Diapherotrites archaeon]
MPENPFVFGKIVREEQFCDREPEIEQIRELVDSNQHLVIISPRRYGKTSLIINALERNRVPYLYVDCSFIEDEKGLIQMVLTDYARKLDNIDTVQKILK